MEKILQPINTTQSSIDSIEDYLDQKIAAGDYELVFENSERRYIG